jgi:hypothetical protein
MQTLTFVTANPVDLFSRTSQSKVFFFHIQLYSQIDLYFPTSYKISIHSRKSQYRIRSYNYNRHKSNHLVVLIDVSFLVQVVWISIQVNL